MDNADYRLLLRNSAMTLGLATLLIILCYYAIDKPVAFFVYQHKINQLYWLKWPTYIPEVFFVLAPIGLITFAISSAWRSNLLWEKILCATSLSVIISALLKTELKFLFGRYWPLTWKDNLSLLQNNLYGFNFFHGDGLNNSFPSGHTAITFAVMSVLWFALPKLRWLWAALSATVIIGLIGLDYHFVSDVIGGACVGALCGYYCVALIQGVSHGKN